MAKDNGILINQNSVAMKYNREVAIEFLKHRIQRYGKIHDKGSIAYKMTTAAKHSLAIILKSDQPEWYVTSTCELIKA